MYLRQTVITTSALELNFIYAFFIDIPFIYNALQQRALKMSAGV